jgi:hypothetical protein
MLPPTDFQKWTGSRERKEKKRQEGWRRRRAFLRICQKGNKLFITS